MVKKLSQTKQQETVKDLKKGATPYNPRRISAEQLGRLKKALEEFGDLGGIVKNIRTGNLVGGNQRVKCIPADAIIQKTPLPVPSRTGTVAQGFIMIEGEQFAYREVDWDEKKEKTANIAANAHGGEWDDEKLGALIKELAENNKEFDLDLIGMDFGDMYQILGDDPCYQQADKLAEMAERLRATKEAYSKMKKFVETDPEKNILDCYLVVIFKSYKERKIFTDLRGLPDNRYVDGRLLQPAGEKT